MTLPVLEEEVEKFEMSAGRGRGDRDGAQEHGEEYCWINTCGRGK